MRTVKQNGRFTFIMDFVLFQHPIKRLIPKQLSFVLFVVQQEVNSTFKQYDQVFQT